MLYLFYENIYLQKIIFTLFTDSFFLLLSFQIFFATVSYMNDDVPLALVLPIMIFIYYIKLLYDTAIMYNEEQRGKAYFQTITGFFIATFVQIGSCTLISPIIISGH